MNTKKRLYECVRLTPPAALLILAAHLAAILSGCGNKDGIKAAKDGEKFPAATPPASFVAERERLRRSAPPPGRPANPQPPVGTR